MNILTVISYLGTAYHGSQIQKNANTVQNEFQKALYSVLGYETPIKACSRTDTGVHASCFCISFTVDPPIDPDGLCYALNNELLILSGLNICLKKSGVGLYRYWGLVKAMAGNIL